MNDHARAKHYHNLEKHVSSIMAQFEAPSREISSSSGCTMDARAPKAEEYSTSNTYLQTSDGGYQCTYPGCAVKTVFNSKTKFEYAYALCSGWPFTLVGLFPWDRANLIRRNHQLQHFPKEFPCLACDQVFERMESCPSHNTNQNGGK